MTPLILSSGCTLAAYGLTLGLFVFSELKKNLSQPVLSCPKSSIAHLLLLNMVCVVCLMVFEFQTTQMWEWHVFFFFFQFAET